MTAELRDEFLVCTVHVTSDTICILHRTIQNSFDGIQFQTSLPLKRSHQEAAETVDCDFCSMLAWKWNIRLSQSLLHLHFILLIVLLLIPYLSYPYLRINLLFFFP
jgi:hypothetical protein